MSLFRAGTGRPMQAQVMYLRQVDRGEDRQPGIQAVTRAVNLADLFGDDDVAEVRSLWLRYPWDPDHPVEFRPVPVMW